MDDREGLDIDFYFILWEKYKEIYHSEFGVGIPHTIVFHNQYPIAWFFTNSSDQILKKRNNCLSNESILDHLLNKPKTKSDVLAFFIENDPLDHATKITYFDEPRLSKKTIFETILHKKLGSFKEFSSLGYFLNNPNERPNRGVLQQFIDPVGEKNALYRATWSDRSCIVQKKISKKKLMAKQLDIYERCCTFDGHEIFSEDCTVAGGALPELIRKCMNKMFMHIFALSDGNSLFKRADTFFKQDSSGKVWLLWNNCNRVQQKNAVGQKTQFSSELFKFQLNSRPLPLEQAIKIPEWVELGATYDQRLPNQIQKDLICQNCGQLRKHTSFASISYKYLIQSREMQLQRMGSNFNKGKKTLLEDAKKDKDSNSKYHQGQFDINDEYGDINNYGESNNMDPNKPLQSPTEQRDKISIPAVFQRLHPRLNDYTYQNIKENPKFYSKQFWVCQICYLDLVSCRQQESGADPYLDHKQILAPMNYSNNKERKPRPLRKEFTKFQQECFNLFLDENRTQQGVREGCSRNNKVDSNGDKKNKSQDQLIQAEGLHERLKVQQMLLNKQLSQQKIAAQNLHKAKIRSQIRTKMGGDLQKNRDNRKIFAKSADSHNARQFSCNKTPQLDSSSKFQEKLDPEANAGIAVVDSQPLNAMTYDISKKSTKNVESKKTQSWNIVVNEEQSLGQQDNILFSPNEEEKNSRELIQYDENEQNGTEINNCNNMINKEFLTFELAISPTQTPIHQNIISNSNSNPIKSSPLLLSSQGVRQRVIELRNQQIKAATHLESILSSTSSRSLRTTISAASSSQQGFFRTNPRQLVNYQFMPAQSELEMQEQQEMKYLQEQLKQPSQDLFKTRKSVSQHSSQRQQRLEFGSQAATEDLQQQELLKKRQQLRVCRSSRSCLTAATSNETNSNSFLKDVSLFPMTQQSQIHSNSQYLGGTAALKSNRQISSRNNGGQQQDSIVESVFQEDDTNHIDEVQRKNINSSKSARIIENSKENEENSVASNSHYTQLNIKQLNKPDQLQKSNTILKKNTKTGNQSIFPEKPQPPLLISPYLQAMKHRQQLSHLFLDRLGDFSNSSSSILPSSGSMSSKLTPQTYFKPDPQRAKNKAQFNALFGSL